MDRVGECLFILVFFDFGDGFGFGVGLGGGVLLVGGVGGFEVDDFFLDGVILIGVLKLKNKLKIFGLIKY